MSAVSCAIIGASGYTGAELANLIAQHPVFELDKTWVSAGSQWHGVNMADAFPAMAGVVDTQLEQLPATGLVDVISASDLFFLATPHEASLQLAADLLAEGKVVIDLSGAFRLKNTSLYPSHYGFKHQQPKLIDKAVYGMAEWHASSIAEAELVAVPGCYPTASGLALKPLMQNNLLDTQSLPVINAISGVSGAGKKAALSTSFCEVSLTPYGIFSHRHQPEISQFLGQEVIFTPHLGNFKRGILATITAKLSKGVTHSDVNSAFKQAYQSSPLVRLRQQAPKIDDVSHSPFCDLFWQLDETTGHIIVVSAIDNLLKGAASQALQCANLRFGLDSQTGLVHGELSS